MAKKPEHSLNYYFLNRFLHPNPYPGYKNSVVSLLINKNNNNNKDKVLVIKEKTGFWSFPKKGIGSKNLADGFFESISQTLETELGLRGMTVYDKKPKLVQKGHIFDFEKQNYNAARAKEESAKGNPTKGKIYHLAVMEYTGDDEFNLRNDDHVTTLDYKWVNRREALELLKDLNSQLAITESYTESYKHFSEKFHAKIFNILELLENMRLNKDPLQVSLFFIPSQK